MADCSVLVCSCDKYEEVWGPFFKLFFKYQNNLSFPVFLLTEKKVYQSEKVVSIPETGDWSNRLIAALNKIQSKYVVLLLDDFFMMKPIRADEIYRVIGIMDSNPNIAAFYFKRSTPQINQHIEYGEYVKMDKSKKYIINFQAGLWEKEALKKILKPHLSPWDIEEKNCLEIDSNYNFYCTAKSSFFECENDVFPYLWAIASGYGVCKSKWLWNNKKLFKKEGIPFKPKQLPVMSKFEFLKNKIVAKIKRILKNA